MKYMQKGGKRKDLENEDREKVKTPRHSVRSGEVGHIHPTQVTSQVIYKKNPTLVKFQAQDWTVGSASQELPVRGQTQQTQLSLLPACLLGICT